MKLVGLAAFASAAAFKSKATGESMSLTFPLDINYAKDNSGITKLIGTMSEGFGALYAHTIPDSMRFWNYKTELMTLHPPNSLCPALRTWANGLRRSSINSSPL
ncbi:MAG: hypothetical protein LBL45_10825 [Treponema sp.]|nr:hypothetical protein [Treponema sp.]